MSLQTLDSFSFNHTDQVDKLYEVKTSAQVKSAFDSRGEDLRVKLNNIVNTLESIVDGDSGADNIGVTPISGITGNKLQVVLEALKALDDTNKQYLLGQIQGVVLGQISDSTITDIKLSDDAGQIKSRFSAHEIKKATQNQLAHVMPDGVTTITDDNGILSATPVGSQLYLYRNMGGTM